MRLCIKLGDERTAIGAFVLAWKLAQKHWAHNNRSIIPNEEWVRAGIGREMIDVGLARETETGVYVSGSERHFAWLHERSEAGRKGGQARASTAERDASGRLVKSPGKHQAPTKQTLVSDQTSSSSSSSFSSSSSNSFLEEEPNKPESVELTPSGWSSPPFPKELVDTNLVEFFQRASIRPKNVLLWLKTYEDPVWLRLELYKTIAWLDANPKKRPKSNYARFIGSWLGRGWEWHRKNINSNPAKDPDGMWDRILGKAN